MNSMVLDVNILATRNNNAVWGLDNTESKSIAGVAMKLGRPHQCYVRLYAKNPGKKVDEILTDKMGRYSFSCLTGINFFIVAHDPESQFNAVIQDNVVPK